MARGENQIVTRPGDRRGAPKLDDRYFVATATLKAAMARAPRIDYRRLRADIDAWVDQDPTPRFWPEG